MKTFGVNKAIASVLPRNAFVKGVGAIAGGTIASQLLVLLVSPVLSRLYSPEEFGMLAVYVALLSIVTIIASMRYELAIPLPESDREAATIVVLCITIIFLTTAACSVALYLGGDVIAEVLRTPRLAQYLWLVPVGVFLAGFQQVFNYWAIRTKQFGFMATVKLRQSVAMVAMQLLGTKLGVGALLGGQAAGYLTGSLSYGYITLRQPEFKGITLRSVTGIVRQYRRFALFSTTASTLSAVGNLLPSFLLAFLFGPTAAGFYAIAHRVLATPVSLIGTATANVFLSNAAQEHREGKLGELVAKTHEALANIGMPPMLVMLIAAPDIFSLLFGERWREAGELARVMVPWLYMIFTASTFSTLFAVLGLQQRDMGFQVVLFTTRLLALFFGAEAGGLFWAVGAYSIASAVCWLFFLCWIAKSSGSSVQTILRANARSLLSGVVTTMPLLSAVIFSGSVQMKVVAFLITLLLIAARYNNLYKSSNALPLHETACQ